MSGLPEHSRVAWRTLELVFPIVERRHLAGVHVHVERSASFGDRVLLVGNHTSWWDGFFHWRACRLMGLDRPHYTVMRQAHIDRIPALRRLGGIGVGTGSLPAARETVRVLRGVRESRARFSVSLFPQGAIWPSSRRPLGFRPGASALVRPLLPCSVVPVAVHIEPGTRPKPTAFVLAGSARTINEVGQLRDHWEDAVTATADRLLEFLHREGETAAERWPPPATFDNDAPVSEERALLRDVS